MFCVQTAKKFQTQIQGYCQKNQDDRTNLIRKRSAGCRRQSNFRLARQGYRIILRMGRSWNSTPEISAFRPRSQRFRTSDSELSNRQQYPSLDLQKCVGGLKTKLIPTSKPTTLIPGHFQYSGSLVDIWRTWRSTYTHMHMRKQNKQ
jgi:hypothetical protein